MVDSDPVILTAPPALAPVGTAAHTHDDAAPARTRVLKSVRKMRNLSGGERGEEAHRCLPRVCHTCRWGGCVSPVRHTLWPASGRPFFSPSRFPLTRRKRGRARLPPWAKGSPAGCRRPFLGIHVCTSEGGGTSTWAAVVGPRRGQHVSCVEPVNRLHGAESRLEHLKTPGCAFS